VHRRDDLRWAPTAADLRAAASHGHGWPAVQRYAADRHGVFCRAEAAVTGVGRDALRRALASGRLVEVLGPGTGVFGFAKPRGMDAHWRAAALSAAGACTGLSGAQVWGLLDVVDADEAPPLHVAIDAGRHVQRPGIRVHRVSKARPTERRQVPVLPVARCVLDLAVDAPVPLVERAVNEALVQDLVTEAALREILAGTPGHHGLRTLGRVVDRLDPAGGLTRSGGERLLSELLVRIGLRGWTRNRRVGAFEFDIVFPLERICVELQSFGFHRTRAAQDRDARKSIAAQEHDHLLLWVTGHQLVHDEAYLAASISSAVQRARARQSAHVALVA
jgi:hypothetical protein